MPYNPLLFPLLFRLTIKECKVCVLINEHIPMQFVYFSPWQTVYERLFFSNQNFHTEQILILLIFGVVYIAFYTSSVNQANKIQIHAI